MAIAQQIESLFGTPQRDRNQGSRTIRGVGSAISNIVAGRSATPPPPSQEPAFVKGALFGGSAKRPGPGPEIADIQAQLNKINFRGSLEDTEDVGAFVPGTALFNELTQAVELADRRDRLQGKTPRGSGIATSINSTGERARLIRKLVGGGSVPRNPETAIEKEQRFLEGLVEQEETVQAKERKARSEIITARAAGPQTLFKRADEIPLPTKLGGGREA